MEIPTGVYIAVGVGTIGVLLYLFEKAFNKSLDKHFEKKAREDDEKEREQVMKDEIMMRGLQIMSECDYELLYAVKNGHHNGGLDKCLSDIVEFKEDVNGWMIKRSAKYGKH